MTRPLLLALLALYGLALRLLAPAVAGGLAALAGALGRHPERPWRRADFRPPQQPAGRAG